MRTTLKHAAIGLVTALIVSAIIGSILPNGLPLPAAIGALVFGVLQFRAARKPASSTGAGIPSKDGV